MAGHRARCDSSAQHNSINTRQEHHNNDDERTLFSKALPMAVNMMKSIMVGSKNWLTATGDVKCARKCHCQHRPSREGYLFVTPQISGVYQEVNKGKAVGSKNSPGPERAGSERRASMKKKKSDQKGGQLEIYNSHTLARMLSVNGIVRGAGKCAALGTSESELPSPSQSHLSAKTSRNTAQMYGTDSYIVGEQTHITMIFVRLTGEPLQCLAATDPPTTATLQR